METGVCGVVGGGEYVASSRLLAAAKAEGSEKTHIGETFLNVLIEDNCALATVRRVAGQRVVLGDQTARSIYRRAGVESELGNQYE